MSKSPGEALVNTLEPASLHKVGLCKVCAPCLSLPFPRERHYASGVLWSGLAVSVDPGRGGGVGRGRKGPGTAAHGRTGVNEYSCCREWCD